MNGEHENRSDFPRGEPVEQGDLFLTVDLSNGEKRQSWWSLLDARKWFRAKLDDGVSCPCCGRFAKRYRRNITVTMAKCLRAIHHLGPHGEWVACRDVARRVGVEGNAHPTGMIGTLVHWGFVEGKENWDDPKRKHSGQWRITTAGVDFVEGLSSTKKYVFLVFNVCDGFGGGEVWFKDLFNENDFDYADVMQPIQRN